MFTCNNMEEKHKIPRKYPNLLHCLIYWITGFVKLYDFIFIRIPIVFSPCNIHIEYRKLIRTT